MRSRGSARSARSTRRSSSSRFAGAFNHTGLPAISVPIEPMIGVQLVGRRGSEARLLGLAAQLEREIAWADRIPQAFA